jgi:hypothetical protein
MSRRKDDGPIESPGSSPTPMDPCPIPPPDPDDTLSPGSRGNSYTINPTRGAYLELHGDIHKGQDPPEEKD